MERTESEACKLYGTQEACIGGRIKPQMSAGNRAPDERWEQVKIN
jgi:hypothetical protein